MKKIIGIIPKVDYTTWGKPVMMIYESIRRLISINNFIPLVILPASSQFYTEDLNNDFNRDLFVEMLDRCDGIILQGGAKDSCYEFFAADYALKNNIPCLGICAGFQIMAMILGATRSSLPKPNLHQSSEDYVHDIQINEDSILFNAIGKNKISVNSRHDDFIFNLDEKYITATCDDIIEALEDKKNDFFVGIQWHPEDLDDENSKKLFSNFF